ncbi:hypothetical protein AAZX31_02G052700 [Glycine max]|uniref:Uncharacterized protein n=2 Tax=Glycine subgen. Soja TaxID=1462606 RepID=K7K6L9_SOYBN|nr:hypothetical protein GYH30_003114 [Glycine max]KRH69908.1 hypothetical protein GLYMA_02G056000v4 [Glycine max]RZC23567.1 hypothetical protein D0Y65_003064 [Glycine soja]
MKTQNVMFVVLVVCLAVCVGTSWGHDFIDDAKTKAGQAKDTAVDAAAPTVNSVIDAAAPTVDAPAPTIDAAAQKSGSFASWAYGKISHGLGFKSGDQD